MEQTGNYYIYSIKNLDNNKFYIGSRTNKCMLNRKPEDDLGIKYFSSSKDKELRQAIKNNNVKYTIIKKYNDAKECWLAEQKLILLYWKFFGKDMSYNHHYINHIGEKIFSTFGKHHTKETKEKISKKGKGRKGPNKGKHFSEETRQKIALSKIGTKASDETKLKMSLTRKGRHHTEETKSKISASHMGLKKGKPAPKFYWKTQNDEIIIMAINTAKQHHPDWICLGQVNNDKN